ncbi:MULTISPECIES: DUF3630 family protein [Alteromonadaceae]|uniref:DUF3630 family protein n=1 Tax=Alteromonadaceae TaxID=72275 RepID=UPI001C088685|nr:MULTISPECIES: DUF3630 family protein [Aliiglaciecola]MBU2880267.1 DUF3630 family protein [Aliiglaciecola lipolytica]MDO6712691.1 DUF3630 family protein [Aliiglaciecola sp. 2_MG-2023]MDO6752924.1 DUF3630 family protein [Aliiglaciecola sp. 1_MG-2023]
MFKLNNYSWQLEESIIRLVCDYFPSQEEAIEQAQNWLQSIESRVSDVSEGADRAQIQFVSDQDTFLLCYDGTCEALWIEVTGYAESTSLTKLLAKLDAIQ